MTKQEVINELYRLQRLQEEGISCQTLIREMETLLWEVIEVDAEEIDEENQKEVRDGP